MELTLIKFTVNLGSKRKTGDKNVLRFELSRSELKRIE